MAAAAGWVLFSCYWEIAAKGAAPARSSESPASRGLHVFLVNIALLMVILPVRGLGRYLTSHGIPHGHRAQCSGRRNGSGRLGRRHLGRNWSGAIAIKVEHQLIRSGPYRLLRHPIYTGLLAMYLGSAPITGEWLALIGLAIAILAYWRKVRLEEAALDVAFGADYDAYRRDTWALIPGLF